MKKQMGKVMKYTLTSKYTDHILATKCIKGSNNSCWLYRAYAEHCPFLCDCRNITPEHWRKKLQRKDEKKEYCSSCDNFNKIDCSPVSDKIQWCNKYKCKQGPKQSEPEQPTINPYASLRRVIDLAYDQAANGKGKERHAEQDQPFTEQPIMAIGRMVGHGYQTGQAMKKLQEVSRLLKLGRPEAAQAELLGAINYCAAAWLLIEEQTK